MDFEELTVRGVRLYHLPLILDTRGNLTYAEIGNGLPFLPQRYFLIFDVPSKEVRGEHAHRTLHQFLVCTKGSCWVAVDDGENRAEVILNSPAIGLYIPPMIWAAQYNYSPDAVLLVLASDLYKPEDYIRNYEEYLQEVGRQRPWRE